MLLLPSATASIFDDRVKVVGNQDEKTKQRRCDQTRYNSTCLVERHEKRYISVSDLKFRNSRSGWIIQRFPANLSRRHFLLNYYLSAMVLVRLADWLTRNPQTIWLWLSFSSLIFSAWNIQRWHFPACSNHLGLCIYSSRMSVSTYRSNRFSGISVESFGKKIYYLGRTFLEIILIKSPFLVDSP